MNNDLLTLTTPDGENVNVSIGDHFTNSVRQIAGTIVGYGRDCQEETDPDEYVTVKTVKIQLDTPTKYKDDDGNTVVSEYVEVTASDLLEWWE